MARRLVEAGIVKDHAAIRFENRGADERCTARIPGTDLVLGDDMSALLDPCADTRDREIWGIDADMHHDDGETCGVRSNGTTRWPTINESALTVMVFR